MNRYFVIIGNGNYVREAEIPEKTYESLLETVMPDIITTMDGNIRVFHDNLMFIEIQKEEN